MRTYGSFPLFSNSACSNKFHRREPCAVSYINNDFHYRKLKSKWPRQWIATRFSTWNRPVFWDIYEHFASKNKSLIDLWCENWFCGFALAFMVDRNFKRSLNVRVQDRITGLFAISIHWPVISFVFPEQLYFIPHTCYINEDRCTPSFGSCLVRIFHQISSLIKIPSLTDRHWYPKLLLWLDT